MKRKEYKISRLHLSESELNALVKNGWTLEDVKLSCTAKGTRVELWLFSRETNTNQNN